MSGSYCDLDLYHDDHYDERWSPEFSEAELFHSPQVDLNALFTRRAWLEESGFFDFDPDNNHDALGALRL